jgi:hypothetical protein
MEQKPESKHIMSIDDDVAPIDLSMSGVFKEQTLDYFFQGAFEEIRKIRSYTWGVYLVFNPFYRKPRQEITTYLALIVGALYGIINRPKLKNLELTLFADSSKEDAFRPAKSVAKKPAELKRRSKDDIASPHPHHRRVPRHV